VSRDKGVVDKSLPYLDTSVLVKIRYGHPSEKSEIRKIQGPRYLSRYVLKEFYQSVIAILIELYFESENNFHQNFQDACQYVVNNTFGIRTAKVLAYSFLNLLTQESFRPELASEKEICRAKLRDYIFLLADDLDRSYKDVGSYRERCARLDHAPRLRAREDRDQVLLRFAETFADLPGSRARCRVAEFLGDNQQQAAFDCFESSALKKGTPSTSKKLSKKLHARRDDCEGTTCTSCAGIGDVIIAANSTGGCCIHSFDQSFKLLAPCFGRSYRIHKSSQQLKKEAQASGDGGQPMKDS
jgi:hypothetical protein